jgi:hypothetical protein
MHDGAESTHRPTPAAPVEDADSAPEHQSLITRRAVASSSTASAASQDPTDWDYDGDIDPAHVPVNPNAVGRLDFPAKDYEDDMCGCCCRCCVLPRCLYKRRLGAAYVLWERKDPKTGDDKVVLMCGAAWSSALITFSLLLGLPFVAYCFLLPTVSLKYTCVRAGGGVGWW